MVQNKALVLARHPVGLPIPGEDLVVTTSTFDLSTPPPPGGIILKNNYISYDPYQRGRMRPASGSYITGFALGKPIDNNAIATVVASANSKFKPGDVVIGRGNFEEFSVITKERADKEENEGGISILKNPLGLDAKLFLGPLGMPGLTAYSSFYEIAKPQKGQTLFVSAASGAVGQIVGQLAKREGLTVIGSVGSDAKLKFIVEELEFDAGFNYKTEKPDEALARLAPGGIDVYYDNVGGEQLDAALGALKPWGRIVSCGSVSQTSLKPEEVYRIKNMPFVVQKRLTIRGFVVFDPDFGPKYSDEHQQNVQRWIKNGEITVKLWVTDGIDKSAEGLVGMLKGENFGKAILKIADL